MYIYTQDAEDVNKHANLIKEVILESLEREGLLKGSAAEVGSRYAVMLHKKGWLGELWDKWFSGIKEGNFKVSFVKIVH